MRKLLIGLAACLSFAVLAKAADIPYFGPGFALQDGGKLNVMVDAINALTNNKVAGEIALDGTNPTAVATGLSSITSCNVNLKLATAPGVGTSNITYSTTAGTLNIYGWKVTSSSDNTLIASTGTETIGYSCSGVK